MCEKCGETENLGIHHVRKLKDLDSKGFFRKMMIARNKKAIAITSELSPEAHIGKI
ncbi:hypothetical protein [Porphyromonas macacae]|uniref:HNH endonuclease n=1 Tax=Porphyromonas macacae TaxID=28115 RepID=UPI0034E5532B